MSGAFEDLATGRYTKQEVIARATAAGLRSRKGLALSPQSFGQMMRNPIYIGKVESPDYGVFYVADRCQAPQMIDARLCLFSRESDCEPWVGDPALVFYPGARGTARPPETVQSRSDTWAAAPSLWRSP